MDDFTTQQKWLQKCGKRQCVRGFLPHQSTHYRSFCPHRNCLSKFVAYWLHTRTMFTRRELEVPRRTIIDKGYSYILHYVTTSAIDSIWTQAASITVRIVAQRNALSTRSDV